MAKYYYFLCIWCVVCVCILCMSREWANVSWSLCDHIPTKTNHFWLDAMRTCGRTIVLRHPSTIGCDAIWYEIEDSIQLNHNDQFCGQVNSVCSGKSQRCDADMWMWICVVWKRGRLLLICICMHVDYFNIILFDSLSLYLPLSHSHSLSSRGLPPPFYDL